MLDELRRISKPRDPAPGRRAVIHIGLGETDRAFECGRIRVLPC